MHHKRIPLSLETRGFIPLSQETQTNTIVSGDTWIYGIGSDPRKLAAFRALLRVRRALHWDSQEPWYRNMSRFLLKIPEHTWGVDIKTTLRDEVSWSNAALQSQLHLSTLPFVATVRSWQRQREYVDWALDALGMCALGTAANRANRHTRMCPHSASTRPACSCAGRAACD